jgi:SPP1 family predicted phage head-tail adaptor
MPLDAGKLRQRLTILELTTEQDSDTGEMEESWVELATVWGSFEPYSVKDYLAAGTMQEQTMARAVIRYRDDVSSNMRVLFRERVYNISGPPLPDPESGKEYLTLMLAEVVNV